MNAKLAKILRRQTGHHHTVPFKYLPESKDNETTIIVDPNSCKGRYKALKKEYRRS